jgi:diguanylate cyclase (GGDEF)-like protein/putative nucleotidyltransferase with HDIG domain
MPPSARVFLVAVCLTGLLMTLVALLFPVRNGVISLWEMAAFVALAAFAGSKKVQILPGAVKKDVGSMSLGSIVTFAAMMRFGPAFALLIGAVSALSACVYPKPQPLYQLFFNVALTGIAGCVTGSLFIVLNGFTTQVESIESFPAVAASALAYFIVNTGGVAAIIALCTKQKPLELWKSTFLWTGPGYFAGASISMFAVMMFGNRTGLILLFAAPIAYLTYQSYNIYTQRMVEREKHINELQAKKAELADLYLATIKSLALAIDAKDQYTHQHILRVQRYAMAIASKLDLSHEELEGLETGALLHDIGKLGVPEYVLLKPGRLTEEEFDKIKKHPQIGADILEPVSFPWPVVPVVKSHHERWDGTGYPEGLKGEEIPRIARVLAVADVYDAMTSSRSYRNAWPHAKVVEDIRKGSGTHFDPVVVDAFLQVIDDVVLEMAKKGEGPLVQELANKKKVKSKADQAAIQIQRASSEIWALYEVAQTTSCSFGLDETLEILGRKLRAIFRNCACVFLLRDEDSPALQVRAAVGMNQEYFDGARTIGANSTTMKVVRNREAYIGEYDRDDMMLTGNPATEWIPLQSALIVPIIHQGDVLGTINVYDPDNEAFNSHARVLLESIAERAGRAIHSSLLYERTQSDAMTDPLTGLYNLRYLTQHVEERCARSGARPEGEFLSMADIALHFDDERRTDLPKESFALLCLDLDSFKPINDNFGHQKGDEVLQDLSGIFRALVRAEDVVARYGGDEFLIVQHAAGPTEAEDLAARIRAAVEAYDPKLVHPRLGQLRLSVSIGYACYPLHGEDCAALLSEADGHMYRNKSEQKLGRLVTPGSREETRLEA